MSAHVFLNLSNELGKIHKMQGLPSIFLSLFRNEFNKFNNTRAPMLDSIYRMTFRGVPAYTQSTQLRTLIFECPKIKTS